MSIFRSLLFVAALSGGALAYAQPVITVNATATQTAYGYAAGQDYTFVFTVNDAWTQSGYEVFDHNQAGWGQSSPSVPAPIAGVSGTGVSGNLAIPSASYSTLFFANAFMQILVLGSGDSIGLSTPGGEPFQLGTSVNFTTAIEFDFGPDVRSPADFLAEVRGTYGASGMLSLYTMPGYNLTALEISSVTFSELSAVPEPSTYAALFGVAALGVVAWRRRRATVGA